MSIVLLSWCPDPSKPAPCSNIPCWPQKVPPAGKWSAIAYDGTVDMRYMYQLILPFSGAPTLWGGHTITFGPHALPDPGAWTQPPYDPGGNVWNFWIATTIYIGTAKPATLANVSFSSSIPAVPFSPTDTAGITATDQAAQDQAYQYVVSNPPK